MYVTVYKKEKQKGKFFTTTMLFSLFGREAQYLGPITAGLQ
jgi:hypothetical protein